MSELEKQLIAAREHYALYRKFFDNCDSEHIDIAIQNLKTAEKQTEMLKKALMLEKQFISYSVNAQRD